MLNENNDHNTWSTITLGYNSLLVSTFTTNQNWFLTFLERIRGEGGLLDLEGWCPPPSLLQEAKPFCIFHKPLEAIPCNLSSWITSNEESKEPKVRDYYQNSANFHIKKKNFGFEAKYGGTRKEIRCNKWTWSHILAKANKICEPAAKF